MEDSFISEQLKFDEADTLKVIRRIRLYHRGDNIIQTSIAKIVRSIRETMEEKAHDDEQFISHDKDTRGCFFRIINWILKTLEVNIVQHYSY